MPEKKSVPITVAEHDHTTDPPTKRVLLYGWDGSNKVRLKTDGAGVLETSAVLSAAASQAVVSTSHASLKAAAQLWGADGTVATVASFANRNALAVVTVDATGAVQSPLVSGASVSAFQGGVWTVAATQSGTWDEVGINDSGNSITVDGTVTAAAQPGVDIGDVTVNNAAGAAAVNVQDGGNSITIDGNVGVSGGSLSAVVLGTVAVTQSGTWDEVGINDSGNSITIDGNVGVSGGSLSAVILGTVPVSGPVVAGSSLTAYLQATPTGVWSQYSNASLTNVAILVKGSAGALGGYYAFNSNSSPAFLQIFDKVSASSVTVGTTAPAYFVGLPSGGGANLEVTQGLVHSAGIVVAAGTSATNGSAPTAPISVSIWYK